jgi:hypothetical protein
VDGTLRRMLEERTVLQLLDIISKGKIHLDLRRRWPNIKTDVKDIDLTVWAALSWLRTGVLRRR